MAIITIKRLEIIYNKMYTFIKYFNCYHKCMCASSCVYVESICLIEYFCEYFYNNFKVCFEMKLTKH